MTNKISIFSDALQAYRGQRMATGKHDRFCTRAVIGIHARGALTERAVTLSGWDLLSLQARTCAHPKNGRPLRRLVFSMHRPRLDLPYGAGPMAPGTGRVSFEAVHAVDLLVDPAKQQAGAFDEHASFELARAATHMANAWEDRDKAEQVAAPTLPQLYWCFRPEQPPVFEATHSLEAWADAEIQIDGLRAWPADLFVRDLTKIYKLNPVDGTPNPWANKPAPQQDTQEGTWLWRNGVAVPWCQRPFRVCTFLSPHTGRKLRTPAVAALQKHGLLTFTSYKQWLDGFTVQTDTGRIPIEPQYGPDFLPLNRAAAFETQLVADLEASPGLLDRVLTSLAELAEVNGVSFDSTDPALNDLAVLLTRPWQPVYSSGLLGIEVVQLVEPPSPRSLGFYSDCYELDLHTLPNPAFAQLEGFVPAPPRGGRMQALQMALRQQGGGATGWVQTPEMAESQ